MLRIEIESKKLICQLETLRDEASLANGRWHRRRLASSLERFRGGTENKVPPISCTRERTRHGVYSRAGALSRAAPAAVKRAMEFRFHETPASERASERASGVSSASSRSPTNRSLEKRSFPVRIARLKETRMKSFQSIGRL